MQPFTAPHATLPGGIPLSKAACVLPTLGPHHLACEHGLPAAVLTPRLPATLTRVPCAGLTGYAFSEDTNPGFPLAVIESLNPSNALEFNRSVFAGPTATWPVSSWIPQVAHICWLTYPFDTALAWDRLITSFADWSHWESLSTGVCIYYSDCAIPLLNLYYQ